LEQIGVRELRQNASKYLSRVQRGETFEITDRGRPVAILRPKEIDHYQEMIDQGRITPATDRRPFASRPPLDSTFRISDELAADRDIER
jgi:prevent-host-death family protein